MKTFNRRTYRNIDHEKNKPLNLHKSGCFVGYQPARPCDYLVSGQLSLSQGECRKVWLRVRKEVKYRSKSAHTCSFLDVKSTIIIAPRIPDKQARRSIQSQRVIGKRRDEVSVIRKTRDEVSERVKNKTARHSKHYLEGRKSNQRKPTCNYNVIPSK